jgi:hypothetical protein
MEESSSLEEEYLGESQICTFFSLAMRQVWHLLGKSEDLSKAEAANPSSSESRERGRKGKRFFLFLIYFLNA